MISGRVLGHKELQAVEFQDYLGEFGNSRSLLHVHFPFLSGGGLGVQESGFRVCGSLFGASDFECSP